MANEVLVEKLEGRIGLLTLNRPEALNSIDRAMVAALRDAIAVMDADDEIDVIVVTAAGERAFCTGIDLKERQNLTDKQAADFRRNELFPMYQELDKRKKPAIAAVFGHTLAGGLELALACDLIIASEDARFGLPEVKWGLIPAAGGCRKLPALIGLSKARELILTAKTISAHEMLALGGLNAVTTRAELQGRALAFAREIAANKQTAVQGARRAIDHGAQAWAADPFDIEVANGCYATKERKSGVASFGAKK